MKRSEYTSTKHKVNYTHSIYNKDNINKYKKSEVENTSGTLPTTQGVTTTVEIGKESDTGIEIHHK